MTNASSSSAPSALPSWFACLPAKRRGRPKARGNVVWAGAWLLLAAQGPNALAQVEQAGRPLTVSEQQLHNRSAWVLDNGLLRVGLLSGGGHIAEVRLQTGDPVRDRNPMRIPHYPTIDPQTYQDEKHNVVYGDDPHRFLSSGYMGHLLCFPYYGPVSSPEEVAAGLGNHGEAPVVEWQELERRITPEAIVFRYGAELSKTHFRVARTVTLRRGEAYIHVAETVENLLAVDRPVMWMQHATFGPPFIEPGKSILRSSAVRGQAGDRLVAGQEAQVRTMPATPHSGSYTALLMDLARPYQFFTLRHADHPLTIGYVYPTAGNPWIGDWQENQRNTNKPWNGKVVARGIEFGSSPYAEGLRKAVARNQLFDTPTFRWIAARERLSTEYFVFLTESEPRNIRVEDGRLLLE